MSWAFLASVTHSKVLDSTRGSHLSIMEVFLAYISDTCGALYEWLDDEALFTLTLPKCVSDETTESLRHDKNFFDLPFERKTSNDSDHIYLVQIV